MQLDSRSLSGACGHASVPSKAVTLQPRGVLGCVRLSQPHSGLVSTMEHAGNLFRFFIRDCFSPMQSPSNSVLYLAGQYCRRYAVSMYLTPPISGYRWGFAVISSLSPTRNESDPTKDTNLNQIIPYALSSIRPPLQLPIEDQSRRPKSTWSDTSQIQL